MAAETKALERLEAGRLQAAGRLADVRQALEREFGWAPRSKAWILPMVAFAAGVALAAALSARKRGR